ncbi:MAG TPA: polysaccharide deacetylase family protein [Xanthobacteraceae bacterium]|jgi:peptidoglycan/xylan/chitin deacetylase (PgdA/CDA1 family)|nr:polysaccharide deacetylase family protein [Xanthobacteraceae bacterium]
MSNTVLTWPSGHRVAVVVSVLLETWSEGKAPSYFPRTSPLPPGSKDAAGINWSRFGGNEGIWRLSRNLADLDIPATLFCNGRSAEVWPEAVAAFAKRGHDVAGHGYLQDQPLFAMNPDRERETIKKTLDILEKVAGKRPTGWVTPIYGWSENTVDHLMEAKLSWCSDALDASVPYRHKSKSGEIVMIPWSDFVDNRALRASPRIYFDVYKDMFDYLHACEPGALINIGVHSHVGGRPAMAAVFRQVLDYLRSRKDVWFAHHHEVAKWIVDQGVEDTSYAKRFGC